MYPHVLVHSRCCNRAVFRCELVVPAQHRHWYSCSTCVELVYSADRVPTSCQCSEKRRPSAVPVVYRCGASATPVQHESGTGVVRVWCRGSTRLGRTWHHCRTGGSTTVNVSHQRRNCAAPVWHQCGTIVVHTSAVPVRRRCGTGAVPVLVQ